MDPVDAAKGSKNVSKSAVFVERIPNVVNPNRVIMPVERRCDPGLPSKIVTLCRIVQTANYDSKFVELYLNGLSLAKLHDLGFTGAQRRSGR